MAVTKELELRRNQRNAVLILGAFVIMVGAEAKGVNFQADQIKNI